MGIVLSSKTITPVTGIECGGIAQVKLSLTAAPTITDNPVDIMLVLDRSQSMAGAPLTALKAAAIEFVDIINAATNGGTSGTMLGFPSRIGVISFNDNATVNQTFTGNVANITSAINGLNAGGFTNHSAAFTLATTEFANYTSMNKKILVMFTDGNTTVGGNANPAATAAKAAGIEIYAIGLGNDIDVANLNAWATDPDSSHVLLSPTPEDLVKAFQDLAANIVKPGATNIVVVDTLYDEFDVLADPAPVVSPIDITADFDIAPGNKSITWTIDKLGLTTTEVASITFSVKHIPQGCNSTSSPVNKTVTYNDTEGNQASFTPNITELPIDCSTHVVPECDVVTQPAHYDSCDTVLDVDITDNGEPYDLKNTGRLLTLGVRLKNICPNRRIAVGVLVTEILNGDEYARGFKAATAPVIPPDVACPCKEVLVKPFTFVLPEGLDEDTTHCDERDFNVRVIAHYIDVGFTDFDFCDEL